MPLRIVICEETPLLRDGLRTLLDAEPDMDVVDATDSSSRAVFLIRACRPDVVVTGPSLRGSSALEMIRRVSTERLDPEPQFVVMIMSDSAQLIDDILHEGVRGLLMQGATRDELISAIRAAARGNLTLAPPIAHRLVELLRRGQRQPDRNLSPLVAELTPREREVLLLVGRGMSAEEIADELVIGVATARTHLYRLRCKLQVRDRAQLVSFAYRAGLMLEAA
jgi:DNA-binding NarL/FixJ family response regulator